MIYKNYKELKNNILQMDDVVIFTFKKEKLAYLVHGYASRVYLYSKGVSNDAIFIVLNIKDRYQFSSKYYKYPANEGMFPETTIHDYEGLTNLTLALFTMCQKGVLFKQNEVYYG